MALKQSFSTPTSTPAAAPSPAGVRRQESINKPSLALRSLSEYPLVASTTAANEKGPVNPVSKPMILPHFLKELPRELIVNDTGFENYGKGPATQWSDQQLGEFMSNGIVMYYYPSNDPKKGQCTVRVVFDLYTSKAVLRKNDKDGVKETFHFLDVDELRFGSRTSVFETLFPNGYALSRVSCSFILADDTIDLSAIDERSLDFEHFLVGAQRFIGAVKAQPALDSKLRRVWNDQKKGASLSEKDTVPLLAALNLKTDTKTAKRYLLSVDENSDGRLEFEEFEKLVLEMMKRPILVNFFSKYSTNKNVLTPAELLKFSHEVQGDTQYTIDYCQKVVEFFGGAATGGLNINQFHDYMRSEMNSAIIPATRGVYQDMTQPLTHYWISSSHNTYLEGDQLSGRSSTDQYVRVLHRGCRCVELDCWDHADPTNPKEIEVIIYHGHTLTSKIKFRDVIQAINDHAFLNSSYPVILSLEIHSKHEGQVKMAHILRQILGDQLLVPRQFPEGKHLPSPEQLKNKIIIKGKDGEDVAKELSEITFLKGGGKFSTLEDAFSKLQPYNMWSWDESVLEKKESDMVVRLTQRHFLRSYPAGTKVNSGNYNPAPWWHSGVQIVALNWQTADKYMAMNDARFVDNGRCGWVLKPPCLRQAPPFIFKHEEPRRPVSTSSVVQRLSITVIDARLLPKSPKGKKNSDIVDPYVVLHTVGPKSDEASAETKVVDDNGFNPSWNENDGKGFQLYVSEIDLVMIRVMDKDTLGKDALLCQFQCPVECLRPGYRCIQLFDPQNRPLPGAHLFLRIQVQ